ncbi:MAG: electron transfer flavoprotein subunit alpha/FixB family protein, partial [Candidatus Bipolaricaulia bacterium]
GELIRVELALEEPRVKLARRQGKGEEEVNIEEAETLICVGRGLAEEEDLEMIRELAAALGGEIGCTRSLSFDYHWLEESRTVGISGKRCKPRLCISIGVSGQIQHTMGIMGSKIIVAINKDPQAPIFKVADYGIVGDLYQVVPKLIERLKD